ncbi:MAG: glycosyltransferase family 2 protein [Sandaracinaceae bacterium]|nr:glycosyltransferase family 2 protein [Sandaracinaceae bacterium]
MPTRAKAAPFASPFRFRIFAIVPAWNEAEQIGRVITCIPSWVERIVVVDDGSTDGTGDQAMAHGDERLELLTHPRRQGVGAAIESGYRFAFSHGAEVAVVMAGDGQMCPSDLESLLAPIQAGMADYVKGNRLDHPERASIPFWRRLGGELCSAFTSMTLGQRIRDSQCGYTAITRHAWEQISAFPLWPSYGYPNDLLVRLYRLGLRVAQVPVRPVYVKKNKGMRPWHVLLIPLAIAFSVWKCRRIQGADRVSDKLLSSLP